MKRLLIVCLVIYIAIICVQEEIVQLKIEIEIKFKRCFLVIIYERGGQLKFDLWIGGGGAP